jgi:uncharacterized RDD family membrane protein YckC
LLVSKPPLDLTATIQTPENIQFEYRIAGPFRRLPALVIDFFVRMMIILAGYICFVAFSSTLTRYIGLSITAEIGLLLAMVFDFLLLWFYGAIFETYWNGQTPGKWACQIRAISTDGRPINAFQATVRNLLRPADFMPFLSLEIFSREAPPAYIIPTFLVSLICMTITRRFQRLGDLAAGTMVVVNERSWVPAKVRLEDPRMMSLSEFIPANFRLTSTMAKAIALYVERRSRIPTSRRLELASYLASPLLKQFGFREDTSPDLLLCAIYYREFVSKDAFTSESKVFRAPPPSNTIAPFADSVTIADPVTKSDVTVPPPLIVTQSPVEASSNVPPISKN